MKVTVSFFRSGALKKGNCYLFGIVVGGILLSLASGPVKISWNEILSWLLGNETNPETQVLLETLRLPRTLSALWLGATLGATGLVLQTLLRNPLAEPYTLGLSGGSSLGAILALSLALEPGGFWIPFLSTIGCLTAAGLVLGLGGKKLTFESRSLILFGVMVSLFFGALVVSGLSILSPQKLQTALFWWLGELGTSRDAWIKFIGPVLFLGLVILWLKARALDALSLGEARALSLGYSPRRERFILIMLCTLMTALSVCISGLLGFIGLVSPHLARRWLKTSRHDVLLMGSSCIGAFLLMLSDSLGRVVAGTSEVPAGSIAALMGAPILIVLLLGQKDAATE